MNINSLDLNLIRVFEAIYSERNLTKAGKKLGITQPGVSSALSRLRDVFDDPLFIKTSKEMEPTAYADHIIPLVRQSLDLINQSLQKNLTFDPCNSRRTFHLTMSDYNEGIVMPALINYFEREGVQVRVSVEYVADVNIREKLESNDIDLALGGPVNIGKFLKHTISKSFLFKEEYVCLVRKEHPILKEKMNLEDYLRYKHIAVSTHGRGLEKTDRILEMQHQVRDISTVVPHFRVVPKVLLNSNLISTVGRRLADEAKVDFSLETLPVPFDLPGYEIHQYWHSKKDHDLGLQWLRGVIESLINESPTKQF